jgi:hypothetical protein
MKENHKVTQNHFKGYLGIPMDTFEELSQSIKAHPSKAQILLEVEAEGKTLAEALGILKSHGVQSIEYDVLRKGNPSCVLFYLSTRDMGEAVLKLTEAGFTRLKGISQKRPGPNKE